MSRNDDDLKFFKSWMKSGSLPKKEKIPLSCSPCIAKKTTTTFACLTRVLSLKLEFRSMQKGNKIPLDLEKKQSVAIQLLAKAAKNKGSSTG